MAEIAGLIAEGYESLDAAKNADGDSNLTPVLNIIQKCWKLDAKLSSYFKRLGNSTQGPLYWSELSQGFNAIIITSKRGCIFPVALHFTNLSIGQICMSYWASCSFLWSAMGSMYRDLSAFQGIRNIKISLCFHS
jgi:hypothetical protein